MNNETINLAQKLIQKQSISPNDTGCQKIIAEILQKAGFKLEWLEFEDTLNLWATHGETEPCVVLAGHTDVVPTGDLNLWNCDPFSGIVKDSFLHGRGSADMKGALAALVIAAKNFVNKNPNHRGKIALLITSDEEAVAEHGTKKVVETLIKRGEKIDFALVGEPSSTNKLGDVIKNGRRGSLSGLLKIIGKQGHAAHPHKAINPIHKGLKFLDELANYKWDEGNEFFPPSSLQITQINAGEALNVIPATLDVKFNIRFNTELNVEKIQNIIINLLNQHQLNYEIEWIISGLPFLTKPGKLTDATKQAVTQFTQITPNLETGGGTSDGRFLALTGAEVVEFGPLNDTIHQINEKIAVNDLILCTEIYEQILVNLLNKQ